MFCVQKKNLFFCNFLSFFLRIRFENEQKMNKYDLLQINDKPSFVTSFSKLEIEKRQQYEFPRKSKLTDNIINFMHICRNLNKSICINYKVNIGVAINVLYKRKLGGYRLKDCIFYRLKKVVFQTVNSLSEILFVSSKIHTKGFYQNYETVKYYFIYLFLWEGVD